MISSEKVTETVERMSTMGVEEMVALGNRMQIEQPFVMVYLLAVTQGEGFTEEETEVLFFVGTAVCMLMMNEAKNRHKITEHDLDKAEKANEALLEKVAGDSEGDFLSAAETLTFDSPEPEVFRYIVESIMDDEDRNAENPPFSEEHIGVAFLYLKNVLDAFIDGQKEEEKK